MHTLIDSQMQRVFLSLEEWTDTESMSLLAAKDITDEHIKGLYWEFRGVLFEITQESDSLGEHLLEEVENLGKEIHNMMLILSDEKFNRYSTLLHIMRDILYQNFQILSSGSLPDSLAWAENYAREVYQGLFPDE